MTGWHLDDDALRRYVERADSLAEGASAEQHLLACGPCRARVTAAAGAAAGVIDLAAVWDRTRDAVEVPRASVFERLLRGAGLPGPEARLVAVASAFRGVWLAGVAAVLAWGARGGGGGAPPGGGGAPGGGCEHFPAVAESIHTSAAHPPPRVSHLWSVV